MNINGIIKSNAFQESLLQLNQVTWQLQTLEMHTEEADRCFSCIFDIIIVNLGFVSQRINIQVAS